MDNIEMRIQAALIRGESPKQIARQLRREGVPEHEIAQALGQSGSLVASQARSRTRRTLVRLTGAAVLLPSLAFNLYYMLYWNAGWMVSGVIWAVSFYGLLLMLFGDFGGGFLKNADGIRRSGGHASGR